MEINDFAGRMIHTCFFEIDLGFSDKYGTVYHSVSECIRLSDLLCRSELQKPGNHRMHTLQRTCLTTVESNIEFARHIVFVSNDSNVYSML